MILTRFTHVNWVKLKFLHYDKMWKGRINTVIFKFVFANHPFFANYPFLYLNEYGLISVNKITVS